MDAIMFSIQPQHTKNICAVIGEANSKPIYKKTIEVRKTVPNTPTPFKGYIYETKGKRKTLHVFRAGDESWGVRTDDPIFVKGGYKGRGKVIGEFVCDKIDRLYIPLSNTATPPDKETVEKATCLSFRELKEYANGNMFLYGLHITDLKIYDEPKELGEFYTACHKFDYDQCGDCPHLRVELCADDIDAWCGVGNRKPLTRPPQSYCYVENCE